ncbi:MAG: glycosyltransferase family 9 protein, partial [Phycisphaerales bacterium]|nr:glycosyltransferase family 9 protein [Hyphomonadaceae bacterium]
MLFLAPADLGETVLATGALAHVLNDGDELTIVCTPEAAPLFRAAPGLARVRRVAANAGIAARWREWMNLARTRFDVVIDARGGVLGGALPAGRRVALTSGPMLRHRVEDWSEALGATRALSPLLWLDEAARGAAAAMTPDAALLVLAPGGVSDAKRWPAERFAAIARRLATG